MSQQLISHSLDLKRLRDEGYEIEVNGGFLLVHQIPYLNDKREHLLGILVSTLTLKNNETTGVPDNHVIYFIGQNPCNEDGSLITAIQHSNVDATLRDGITVNRSFSNKPATGYPNYYEKVKRYADIISAPAKFLDPSLTEKTFKVITDHDNQGVFHYLDTNSSRANIDMLNNTFSKQKIAIIGLGGTGAYILDLVAKTPVAEVHIYDGDSFDQHNAFRSPGASSIDDLRANLKKAEFYATTYSKMHRRIISHPYYVRKDIYSELDNMSYVFICVDKNSVRKSISDYLASKDISFIDVGLGVNVAGNKLMGAVRVTCATAEKSDHLTDRIFSEDNDNNDYVTNIQIADLNCLNAALAVIKWKKLSGFYVDQEGEHHSSYSIGVSKIFNEDVTA